MLKITCPKCKTAMELENTAAGHKLACECGSIYTLPPAPPMGNFRICANCARLCEAEAKACPECSFNFITHRPHGSKSVSSDSEKPLSFIAANKPLVAKSAFLLVIIICGLFIYFSITASKIGLSKRAPLGVMKNGKYNTVEFEPSELKLPPDLKNLKIYCRKNTSGKKGFMDDSLLILTDEKGVVKAVSGSYFERSILSLGVQGTNRFFEDIAQELKVPADDDLVFNQIESKDGGLWNRVYLAQWENKSVRLDHRKPSGRMSSGLHIIVYAVKDTPLESISKIRWGGFADKEEKDELEIDDAKD